MCAHPMVVCWLAVGLRDHLDLLCTVPRTTLLLVYFGCSKSPACTATHMRRSMWFTHTTRSCPLHFMPGHGVMKCRQWCSQRSRRPFHGQNPLDKQARCKQRLQSMLANNSCIILKVGGKPCHRGICHPHSMALHVACTHTFPVVDACLHHCCLCTLCSNSALGQNFSSCGTDTPRTS